MYPNARRQVFEAQAQSCFLDEESQSCSETEAAKATLQATERLRSRAVFLSGLVAPFRRAFRFVFRRKD